MAQNKLFMQVRRYRSQMRDAGRVEGIEAVEPVIDTRPGTDREASGLELLELLHDRLDDPERDLALRRVRGQTWNDIAAELAGTPQSHRMRLTRAINRLAPELGLDDPGHPDD